MTKSSPSCGTDKMPSTTRYPHPLAAPLAAARSTHPNDPPRFTDDTLYYNVSCYHGMRDGRGNSLAVFDFPAVAAQEESANSAAAAAA